MPSNLPNSISIELIEKSRPKQKRAIQTYDRILESAAHLLNEIGVERISTNLIAERADITVPALYRYFSNKYEVLYALAARLMDQQNKVMLAWYQRYTYESNPFSYFNHIDELLQETFDITKKQTAGLAILRMMRVIAPLQEIRLKSYYTMAEWAENQWAREDWNKQLQPQVRDNLQRHLRLLIELGTQTIEMALEDPDMPAKFAFAEYGLMVRQYLESRAKRQI